MVTLEDIARRAGVSIFTVSCALRGYGRVAPATGERIRRLAAEMGYQPNVAASLLARARGRSGVEHGRISIAVLRFATQTDPETQQRDQFMRDAARAAGYTLDVFLTSQFDTPASLSRVLWARGVQGLILLTSSAPPGFRLRDMNGFEWDRFSLVKISRGFDELRCHTVRLSVFSQMRYALDRIAAAGYRRVGILLVTETASNDDDWGRRGAIEAYRRLRRHAFEHLEVLAVPEVATGLPAQLEGWLKDLRPDLLLAFPFAWRFRLEEAGYRMPEDFAYVGLPVLSDSEGDRGRPTSGPLDDFLGQEFPAALHMLSEEIAAGHRGIPDRPYEHVLPVVWQTGVTMPDPAPTARSRRIVRRLERSGRRRAR